MGRMLSSFGQKGLIPRPRSLPVTLLSLALLFALLTDITFAGEDPPNADADVVTFDGYYLLLTPEGNAISLNKASLKNGTEMVLKKNSSDSIGRQFFLISSPGGNHTIKNSISFKALSIKGNSKKNGVAFIQKTDKKEKAQRFRLIPSGDGWYYLKSASGSYVSAARDKPGAKVVTTGDRTTALKIRLKKTDYSTGMPKLDAKIKAIRKDISSGGDVLKKSFKYVITKYDYRDHPNDFKGDWISRYAWAMVSKKQGHCKNFASTVCLLFRSYGYDARVVTGHVRSRSRGWAVHGWVEARVKGKTYIFDPSFAHARGFKGWYKRTYKNSLTVYRIGKRW